MSRNYGILVLSTLSICSLAAAQPSITAKFLFRSHTTEELTLPYRLFVPDTLVPGERYPLVLALHGSGEAGTDNMIHIESYRLATVWADPVNQAAHPCFVLAPQAPQGSSWGGDDSFSLNTVERVVLDMLDSLTREFPVDTNRFYVTGLSLGGFGTWDLIVKEPGRWAAAVPICGGGYPDLASRAVEIPIWDFHGARDNTVPVEYSRVMIAAMEDQGRRAVYTDCRGRVCSGMSDSAVANAIASREDLLYTEYAVVDHFAWIPAYDDPLLIPWVFGFAKRSPDAIRLTSLATPMVVSGDVPVTWTTAAAGDSVELWFSSNGGDTWARIAGPLPDRGSYLWKTDSVADCVFGRLKVALRREDGVCCGLSTSAMFCINNASDGQPGVRILNTEFYSDPLFDQDSLDLRLVIGDPEFGPVDVQIVYETAVGGPAEGVASFPTQGDTTVQVRRIGLAGLGNSDAGVLKVLVSDGTSIGSAATPPFVKRTPRTEGPRADHVKGVSGADVFVNVVAPGQLTGHAYRVTFRQTRSAPPVYDVFDVTDSTMRVSNIGGLDGHTESPAFDGVRLLVRDYPAAKADLDSSRWIRGLASITANIFVPARITGTGHPYPYDYLLTLSDTFVDTSIAAFGLDAVPMKFLAHNLTLDSQADVCFFDGDGDGTISAMDEVDFLERDSLGAYQLSWAVFFVAGEGDTLPVPGDQFLLKTIKPLTSADVFEFTTPTASGITADLVPTTPVLEQNYPNPFNPSTTIRYALPERSFVTLVMYNILGQRVVTLAEGEREAGYHEVRFEASGLASGVYLYRLRAGTFVQTKKLSLVR
jgi:predicted esterase